MMTATKNWRDVALPLWALIVVIFLYWLGSATFKFLPGLGVLVTQLPGFLSDSGTYAAIGATVQRVVVSLVFAVTLGFGMAYLMARDRFAGKIASAYVNVLLIIPSTIAALVALFVFRRNPIAVYIVVVLITVPFISITLLEGIKSIDPKLDTMASMYRFSRYQVVRHVVLPHLVPFIVAAVRNENAHAWRVVILAELFAVNSGMGWEFTRAWDRFLVVPVLLWLATFMILLLVAEYGVLVPLERLTQRWRKG